MEPADPVVEGWRHPSCMVPVRWCPTGWTDDRRGDGNRGGHTAGWHTYRGHWWILVVIAGAQLMVVLDTTIMIIALPSAQKSLGFSNADRQWVVTAYTLGFGGLLLLGGRISDMIGPKRTLIIGVIGFAAASALGGASQTTGMLIGARALQGMFAALLAPSVLSLLATTFTGARERGRAFGIYASIAIGGAAFGLILGGLLTQYLDWRWCLYVNLPIAAAVVVGAITMIPRPSGQTRVRLDIPGAILGCSGLVALVYGLGEAGTVGWSTPRVIGPLIVAAVLLAAFVFRQTRAPSPLLPLRILADRNRAGSFLTIILAVFGMYGTFLFLTYLLQTVDGYSPFEAGVAFLPLMAINGLAATQLASRLLPRVPTRLLVIPGLVLASLGVALLTQLTPDASYVSHILPTELLLGLGLGIAMVPCISTATNKAEPRDVGITSATTNTSQQVGASVGTALLNTIAASTTAAYLATHARTQALADQATVHGFAVASGWAAAALLVGAVVGGVMINAHPGEDTGTGPGHRHPRGLTRPGPAPQSAVAQITQMMAPFSLWAMICSQSRPSSSRISSVCWPCSGAAVS